MEQGFSNLETRDNGSSKAITLIPHPNRSVTQMRTLKLAQIMSRSLTDSCQLCKPLHSEI